MSYAHVDSARVKPLVHALRDRGVRVWFDQTEISTFESITERIVEGLGNSKALLAFYSETYPKRRACQWELTAAFLAGQNDDDARRRVLVINPEAHANHIHPVELRDALFQGLPEEGKDKALAVFAEHVCAALSTLTTPLSVVRPMTQPPWFGGKGLGSNRFVGRTSEMWAIHSALFANDAAVITAQAAPGHAQLRATGGIGKSLLAEEYALRFGAAYPGGVFVLKGTIDRDDQISDLASRTGLKVQGLSSAEIDGVLQRQLQGLGKTYLWLVDDLPGGMAENERRRWFAPTRQGKTLITTRSAKYGSTGAVIDLGILDAQEGYALLTVRRQPEGPEEQHAAQALVAELGGHALAIDIAGGALATLIGQRSFEEFLASIRAANIDALEIASQLGEELPNGHERSLATTLLTSIGLLDEPGLDFLRIAGLLAPGIIPYDIVDRVFEASGRHSPFGARVFVDRVVAHSLVEALREGYLVHTLVARTIRLHDKQLDRKRMLRELSIRALLEKFQMVPDGPRHEGLMGHLAHARHLGTSPETLEEALLVTWVGNYDQDRGSYDSARVHYEAALDVCKRLLGDEHANTLRARLNVAGTLFAQGDLTRAREHQEAVLNVSRQLHGDEHPDTLSTRLQLAITLSAQGQVAGARRHREIVLATTQRLHGDGHAETLTARHNLAQTLFAQGDLDGAREHQEAVLQARRPLLGDAHPHTLVAMHNLAQTLLALGDLDGAREHAEAVMALRRRLDGEEHPDTLSAANTLAGMLVAQGDLAGARRLLELVLETSRRLWGDQHPDALLARNNLTGTLWAQGEVADAPRLQEAVLEGTRQRLGDESPDTLRARSNYAGMLFTQGNLTGAREHQEAVLEATRRLLGEDALDTLRARNNLAATLFAQRDLTGAGRQLKAAWEGLRKVLGDEHYDTLVTRHSLALTLFEQGDLANAHAHQEAVLQARLRLLGDEHADAFEARSSLAKTLFAQGDLQVARGHQEVVLEATRRLLGEQHNDTLNARLNLAQTLFDQGEIGAAFMEHDAIRNATNTVNQYDKDSGSRIT